VLTIVGIAIGASMPMSVAIVNRSISDSFMDTVNGITGKAVLQVTGDENGFNEETLSVVKATPGVRVAVPLILGSGFIRGLRGESINVFGVDLLEDGEIRTYRDGEGIIDDPIAFLNQPDSVILTTDLAKRLGVGLEQPIELLTVHGLRSLTVRALIDPGGPLAKAFAGNLAIMDVFAAQQVFGKESKFDEIDIAFVPGFDPDQVAAELQSQLPSSIEVRRPEYRSGQVDRMLRSFQMMLSGFSLVALLVGVFLIYNTMSIAVSQRQREIGILRAIGMTRGRVRLLFLIEALVIAIIGSTLGVGLGVGLARVILSAIAFSMSTAFFINFDVQNIVIPPAGVGVALVSGIAAATLAGIFPARRASRVSPITAMYHTIAGATVSRVSGRSLIVGTALLLSVPGWIVLVMRREGGPYVVLGDLALYVGFATLVPFFVIHLARLLRPACGAIFGMEGLLACDSVTKWADRTAVTVAVLAISLSFSVMVGSLAGSFKASLLEWLNQAVPVDFTVSSNRMTAGWLRAPMDAGLGTKLAGVEGVERVLGLRVLQQNFRGRRITIKAMDIEPGCVRCGQHSGHLPFEEGDWHRATLELAAGRSVLVSNNFALHFDVHAGDSLKLNTPYGEEEFRVAGVVVEYTSDQGVIIMNRRDFYRAWRDNLVNYFNIFARADADLGSVRRQIAETYGEVYQIRILDSRAQNQEVMERIDQSFKFVAAVEILAFAIAFLGILNTLLVSILERMREIGILRAVGARRGQILKIVLIEAGLIGFAGATAGIGLGGVSSVIWVRVNFKHLMGWVLEYSFPTEAAVAVFGIAAVVAVLAGLLPAALAARTSVVKALATE
jgi:putative ABC transport system permease protein